MTPGVSPADEAAVAAQLGRTPRGMVAVSWRCPCGRPGVVQTAPRLPDGTPFPTLHYLTCRAATAGCSTLEAQGVMAQMAERLATDPQLASAYAAAHEAYLAERAAVGEASGVGDVPEIAGVTAGGMPTRVKCLHALVAHALAAGPGVNPLGDEAVELLGEFWRTPCVQHVPGVADVPVEDVSGEDVPEEDVPGEDIPGEEVPGEDVPEGGRRAHE